MNNISENINNIGIISNAVINIHNNEHNCSENNCSEIDNSDIEFYEINNKIYDSVIDNSNNFDSEHNSEKCLTIKLEEKKGKKEPKYYECLICLEGIYIYSDSESEYNSDSESEPLLDITNNSIFKTLCNCKYYVHEKCISAWIKQKPRCPLCDKILVYSCGRETFVNRNNAMANFAYFINNIENIQNIDITENNQNNQSNENNENSESSENSDIDRYILNRNNLIRYNLCELHCIVFTFFIFIGISVIFLIIYI